MVDYKSSLVEAAKTLCPKITHELNLQSSKRYGAEKWTLERLNQWRFSDLPKDLQARHAKSELHLTKDELALLMDWKLAFGKFRPALPKLIRDNSKETVEEVTKSGFLVFTEYALQHKSWSDVDISEYQKPLRESLKKLSELRGVGPATASLLLSLLKEVTPMAPSFFSDEAFLYFVQEPLRSGLPIKYNVKEYIDDYVPIMIGVARKYSIESLEDLERGAWALKTYQMHSSSKLSDVELTETIDSEALEKFAIASDFVVEPVKAVKRSAESKPKNVKKPKKA